jgi:hypothetical protein
LRKVAAVADDLDEDPIWMVPGVTRRVMRRRGIRAIFVGGLPIGGSGEVGLVTGSAILPVELASMGDPVWVHGRRRLPAAGGDG